MNRLRNLFNRFQSDEALIEALKTAPPDRALRLLDELKERRCVQDGTLRDDDFSGITLDTATFATCDLRGIDFSGASLHICYFYEATLNNATFDHADLSGANCRAASLQNASLIGATLTGVNFSRADMSGAVLREADLSGANFWQTTLVGVDLQGATLRGATITDVVCDATTILPDGSAWSPQTTWAAWTATR